MAALSTGTYGQNPPKATTITAGQAQDGDVVLASDGNVYQCMGDGVWGNITPIGSYGPLWEPDGQLTLLARDGHPHVASDHG